MSTNVGVVGLNYWGPNLVRNFAALSDLSWVCDLDEQHLAPIAERYPSACGPTTSGYSPRRGSRPI